MSIAFALLGLLEERPRHGYELKHLFDDRFAASPPLKFGQVYTTLARLRRDGMIDISAIEAGAGPDRKLYLIAPTGVADLERWLYEPEPAEAYGRNVLFTKVVLALMSGRSAEEILDCSLAANRQRVARQRPSAPRRSPSRAARGPSCPS